MRSGPSGDEEDVKTIAAGVVHPSSQTIVEASSSSCVESISRMRSGSPGAPLRAPRLQLRADNRDIVRLYWNANSE